MEVKDKTLKKKKSVINSYPRTRPTLSPKHEDIYLEEYKLNREGGGLLYKLVRMLESWNHKIIARNTYGKRVLEIGAGTLNHLPYEPDVPGYDVVEPFEELWLDSQNLKLVSKIYADIKCIPPDINYDRILSIATLEHIVDLPTVIAKSGILMSEDGFFQAGIPSEGGLLWGLSWRLTTGIAYRIRTGLDYKTVMRHEHVNTARDVICVISHFFNNIKVKRFPLPWLHLSFYTYIEARNPYYPRCVKYLQKN